MTQFLASPAKYDWANATCIISSWMRRASMALSTSTNHLNKKSSSTPRYLEISSSRDSRQLSRVDFADWDSYCLCGEAQMNNDGKVDRENRIKCEIDMIGAVRLKIGPLARMMGSLDWMTENDCGNYAEWFA